MKDTLVRDSERERRAKEGEERAVYVAQREEIARLNGLIDSMQVVIRGKDREGKDKEREFKESRDKIEGQYQSKIRDLEQVIDSLKKAQKDS
jgi:uncharacterized protein with von Willebrand factor type A (vWA) domain